MNYLPTYLPTYLPSDDIYTIQLQFGGEMFCHDADGKVALYRRNLVDSTASTMIATSEETEKERSSQTDK